MRCTTCNQPAPCTDQHGRCWTCAFPTTRAWLSILTASRHPEQQAPERASVNPEEGTMITLGPKTHPWAPKPEPQPDFIVDAEGDWPTLYSVRPLNDAAHDWLDEHTDGTWLGGALCVEHRYVRALVDGIIAAGFDVA